MVSKDVVVLGAGVIGLTAARRLQQAGYRVSVVAQHVGLQTTSARAAAVWLPFRAEPRERVAAWGHRTYRACRPLAAVGGTGVSFLPLRRYSRIPVTEPFWRREDIPFRGLRSEEVPRGYKYGWEAEVPFFEAPKFLDWLLAEFLRGGGALIQDRVAGLAEAAEVAGLGPAGVVVHCAGLGARQTVEDETMYPIRGQTVRVRPPFPLTPAVDDDRDDEPAYVLPRGAGEVILGGTAQVGDERTEVDPAEEQAILARCRPLWLPESGELEEEMMAESVAEPMRERQTMKRTAVARQPLPGWEILETTVGLRPGRPEVRLEVEPGAAAGRPVVHNYGHGGSGYTVCWGCADEVVERVAAL